MIALAGAVALGATASAHASAQPRTEVVVTLDAPSLAAEVQDSRVLTVATKARRLGLSSPASLFYLHQLELRQNAVARRIERSIPTATVRWRYKVVLDGLAVVLPTSALPTLSRIAGVAVVYPDTKYELTSVAANQSPEIIGADQLWGLPGFSTAGQGEKIGIVDEGIDQAHPYFNPAGYAYPPGFPKGDTAFTTPKVIVARAFAPAGATWKYANTPFDSVNPDHATHVAGIAAGDYTADAGQGLGTLSGVAPRAYLGNYKALTIPTPQFGLDGNAPEIAAAIEAAVTDGMDVINLSIGEPEIEPSRDLVDAAINGAAAAGVVPTIAAGNEFEDEGDGSVSSPGNASAAITAAAVTNQSVIAPFSSGGPTPVSLQFKPDVSAPGVSILSSVPPRIGLWSQFSGTSMAAPHVAGAAALLRQRHPTWTVEQIKSALVLTGRPVTNASGQEVPSTREGGGLIYLPTADNPLIFADPTATSFGLVKAGKPITRTIQLTDAGGGAGAWTVSVDVQDPTAGVAVTAPATVTVPAALIVQATVAGSAAEADVTGFVVLQNGTNMRRIPFWLRSEHPRLEKPVAILRKAGSYKGNTKLGQSRVSSYRYPDNPTGSGVSNNLPGPEQVFRVVLSKRVANFGVIVTSTAKGTATTPRIVFPGDENHLVGMPALPVTENPYQDDFGQSEPVAGVIAPASRTYDVVFDTRSKSSAGPFTFRLWINDTAPPTAKLLTPTVKGSGELVVAVQDAGSGVDPDSLAATVDGSKATLSYSRGRVSVDLNGLAAGTHKVALSVSDYQETKNMETFGGILPNTRVYAVSFRVR
ncbi:MAG TPA: S8 family serine peptidase [Gaiellaceae bacterium]|nr:S8 family serine peptidase [Gaiellaceae bacterium]